ncbi:MAG TPA: SRPBCC family protein [Burkholderiales bacterium]|nr:SRPBCC family protein [Burkholderiales bacterium]
MNNFARAILLVLVWFATQTLGADGNELSARQSIRINAAPETVWAVVGNFNGTPRWLPLVVKSEIVLGTNNRVGAIRLVTRRNGTKVTERLLDRDPHDMHMAYTYVDGAVMATDYSPVLSVKDAGDGTSIVEWSAHFKPLAYSNEATSAQDERALTDFFDGVYKTGLDNLKRVVESGE